MSLYYMYTSSAFDRKKTKIRKKIAKQSKYRLTVYKSNKHIYVQLFTSNGSKVIMSLSSLDKIFRQELNLLESKNHSKVDQAALVGVLFAKKLKDKNIDQVVFDRSGFKFHGRIKAVADSILSNGILC